MIVIIDALCYAPVICMPRCRLGPGDTGDIAVCRKMSLVAYVYALQCYFFMETDVKVSVLYLVSRAIATCTHTVGTWNTIWAEI